MQQWKWIFWDIALLFAFLYWVTGLWIDFVVTFIFFIVGYMSKHEVRVQVEIQRIKRLISEIKDSRGQ
jgi:hypothetical protein